MYLVLFTSCYNIWICLYIDEKICLHDILWGCVYHHTCDACFESHVSCEINLLPFLFHLFFFHISLTLSSTSLYLFLISLSFSSSLSLSLSLHCKLYLWFSYCLLSSNNIFSQMVLYLCITCIEWNYLKCYLLLWYIGYVNIMKKYVT